ncbi:hypothetical protein SNL152K_6762 [Streptomyces sp. NL15-2K]|nr:hypothetical protein SNL152K_6762 [Streptomyces sp. NL15-2K]
MAVPVGGPAAWARRAPADTRPSTADAPTATRAGARAKPATDHRRRDPSNLR